MQFVSLPLVGVYPFSSVVGLHFYGLGAGPLTRIVGQDAGNAANETERNDIESAVIAYSQE